MAIHGKDARNGKRGYTSMQSRHYAAIAATIASERYNACRIIPDTIAHEAERQGRLDAVCALAEAMAKDMKAANANFKRERFMAACGFGEED